MACYRPIVAWRSADVNSSGKRSLVFAEKKSDGNQLEIPCGGCIGCRLDRSSMWSIRLLHESRLHEVNSFITMTYDDLHLPASGSLVKKHVQDFMKRLRRRHAYHNNGAKFRYYLCGEYGDTTFRPHYHAIIFGVDFADKRTHSKGSNGDQLYTSKVLDDLWRLGHCFIGSVTAESCGYVSRYIMKKVTGDRAEDHYRRVDPVTGETWSLLPEYNDMSRRPGIGKDYYEKFKKDFYPRDSAVVKGKERKVPKYYDRLLELSDPDLLAEIKDTRVAKSLLRQFDNTTSRLKVREEVTRSRIQSLKRSL